MTIYCPECGTANNDQNWQCTDCGQQLPRQGAPLVARSTATLQSVSDSWWQQLRPDIRAALAIALVMCILSSINSLTGGLACIGTAPFLVVSVLAHGVLVGKYAENDFRFEVEDYPRLALYSVFYMWLIVTAFSIISVVISLGVTLGAVLAVMPILLLNYFGTVVLNAVLTPLAAWLYGRYGNKQFITLLIVVGIVSIIGIFIFMAIMAAIGIALFW